MRRPAGLFDCWAYIVGELQRAAARRLERRGLEYAYTDGSWLCFIPHDSAPREVKVSFHGITAVARLVNMQEREGRTYACYFVDTSAVDSIKGPCP
jgi:hypothetical protein